MDEEADIEGDGEDGTPEENSNGDNSQELSDPFDTHEQEYRHIASAFSCLEDDDDEGTAFVVLEQQQQPDEEPPAPVTRPKPKAKPKSKRPSCFSHLVPDPNGTCVSGAWQVP